MEKLVIKKRTSEELACWKVKCDGVYPNTVVEADAGLTILVNADGQNKLTTQRSFTLNSLYNPGHNTKLIGGKKPYATCEIYAIDISTEFKSEWGLAGPSALPCYDAEFEIEAKAVCFGEALKHEFKNYAERIIKNTAALAKTQSEKEMEIVRRTAKNLFIKKPPNNSYFYFSIIFFHFQQHTVSC